MFEKEIGKRIEYTKAPKKNLRSLFYENLLNYSHLENPQCLQVKQPSL